MSATSRLESEFDLQTQCARGELKTGSRNHSRTPVLRSPFKVSEHRLIASLPKMFTGELFFTLVLINFPSFVTTYKIEN